MKNITKVAILVVIGSFAAYHFNQNAKASTNSAPALRGRYEKIRKSWENEDNVTVLEKYKTEIEEMRGVRGVFSKNDSSTPLNLENNINQKIARLTVPQTPAQVIAAIEALGTSVAAIEAERVIIYARVQGNVTIANKDPFNVVNGVQQAVIAAQAQAIANALAEAQVQGVTLDGAQAQLALARDAKALADVAIEAVRAAATEAEAAGDAAAALAAALAAAKTTAIALRTAVESSIAALQPALDARGGDKAAINPRVVALTILMLPTEVSINGANDAAALSLLEAELTTAQVEVAAVQALINGLPMPGGAQVQFTPDQIDVVVDNLVDSAAAVAAIAVGTFAEDAWNVQSGRFVALIKAALEGVYVNRGEAIVAAIGAVEGADGALNDYKPAVVAYLGTI